MLFTARRLSVVAALSAGLVVTACGSDSGSTGGSGDCSDGGGPVKVAQVMPLSGPAAESGKQFRQHAQVAVDYFNSTNSICGQELKLIVYDDKGDPATALAIGREIVATGITLVMNDSFGAQQNALHPLLMKSNVVVVNNTGQLERTDPKTNPTGFSYGPDNSQYAQNTVDWAIEKGFDKIGIMSDGSIAGEELSELMEDRIEEAGLDSVGKVTYSPTAVDLTAQLAEQRQAGAETIFLAAYTGITPLLTGLKQMGWDPDLVAPIGAMISSVDPGDVPDNAVDACYTYLEKDAKEHTVLTEENLSLLTAIEKEAGGPGPSTSGILMAYNSLLVMKAAVEAAGTTDGAKVAEAVENITDLPGSLPGLTMSFSEDDHVGFPSESLRMCTATRGEHGIPYLAE